MGRKGEINYLRMVRKVKKRVMGVKGLELK